MHNPNKPTKPKDFDRVLSVAEQALTAAAEHLANARKSYDVAQASAPTLNAKISIDSALVSIEQAGHQARAAARLISKITAL